MYVLYVVIAMTFAFLRKAIPIFLMALPGNIQWIIAFVIQVMKLFEVFVQSKLLNRMVGGQEEESKVLLDLYINLDYSLFIAIRLPNAGIITVCFILAIDLFLQLKAAYKIVQFHKAVSDETTENRSMEKQRMVTEFVLSELTECITPIVYAVGFYTAYYGYNGEILGDVKNGYWEYTPVDDIGYLFQMMLLLFGVDTLITLVNYFILSTFANVNLFQESC